MREFDFKERKYIIENQDTVTLGDMAKRFKCDWHEVYNCFDKITKTKSYKMFIEKRKENIANGECFGKEVEYVEVEEGRSYERDNNKFFNPPSTNGRRTFDNVDYFKYGRLQQHD